MGIQIPKVYRPLDLGDYAEEFRGTEIQVWVNPSRQIKREYYETIQAMRDARKEEDAERMEDLMLRASEQLVSWYSQMWNQNGRAVFGTESIKEFAANLMEADPAMWQFLTSRTWSMIQEQYDSAKKA